VRKQRQRLRSFHEKVKSYVEFDQLNTVCLTLEEAELQDLGDHVEKALKKHKFQAAAHVFHNAMEKIGLKPITQVKDDDAASTSSGPSSYEKEDPEAMRERLRREAIAQAKREEEDKVAAAERAKREAEKSEEKKKRDEQKRKELAAQEASRRQQDKKEEQKAKKAAEKKQRDAEEAVRKKEETKIQAQIKAQEQSENAKMQAEAHKQEMETERLVQLFSSDRIDRMNNYDKATDVELTAMLEQFVQENAGLAAAFHHLKSDDSDMTWEAAVDRGVALVFRLNPHWVLGLPMDSEIRLPNAVRNRAKKYKQSVQKIMQAFIAKVQVAKVKAAAMSELQRGIVDGSIEVPVFGLELKDELEEAVKAAEPPPQEESTESPAKSKKKKPAKKNADDEDLDKLLAEIESPTVSKKAGKKKK